MSPVETEILHGMWQEMKVLNGRVDTLRVELKGDIAELRKELKADIAEVRTELKAEISEVRRELRTGLAMLGGRIDNLLLGEHGREHATIRERLERLEGR